MNNKWLVFSCSLTAKQQALRVKIWRRLTSIGAVALKNSLHLLPDSPECLEHLNWLVQEAESGGGEAVILTCVSLGGMSDSQAQELFRQARDSDYATVEAELAAFRDRLAGQDTPDQDRREARAFLRKAERRLASLREIDFFPSGRGERLRIALDEYAAGLDGAPDKDIPPLDARSFRGRTWVTRAKPYIDRLSSIWLVRRHLDREAAIRFLTEGESVPVGDEYVTFDMPGAQFTHQGELVTYEVLLRDFGIADTATRRLGRLVKAVDLADDNGEEGGLPADARVVKDILDGLVRLSRTDEELLARACLLFDALAQSYSSNP